MNPLQLANILGHTSLAMISITYAHMAPSDAHDAMIQLLQAEQNATL